MSIVKKLVDQMKEPLHWTVSLAKGSTVQITLPIQIDETQSAQPMDTALDLQSNIADMHVLLVEDNEINCEIVEFMLKEAGAEVVTANDGQSRGGYLCGIWSRET